MRVPSGFLRVRCNLARPPRCHRLRSNQWRDTVITLPNILGDTLSRTTLQLANVVSAGERNSPAGDTPQSAQAWTLTCCGYTKYLGRYMYSTQSLQGSRSRCWGGRLVGILGVYLQKYGRALRSGRPLILLYMSPPRTRAKKSVIETRT